MTNLLKLITPVLSLYFYSARSAEILKRTTFQREDLSNVQSKCQLTLDHRGLKKTFVLPPDENQNFTIELAAQALLMKRTCKEGRSVSEACCYATRTLGELNRGTDGLVSTKHNQHICSTKFVLKTNKIRDVGYPFEAKKTFSQDSACSEVNP